MLINNAGLGGEKRVAEMTDEEWSRVLDITLTGTFRMTRAMLPHMEKRGRGAIVNNASVLGWRAQKGQAHYAAAKAGVMALTRCSAVEAAEHGVRINAVSPSIALHEFLKKASSEELLAQLGEGEAARRAVHQLDPQPALERVQPASHDDRRHPLDQRGRRKAALLGDQGETADFGVAVHRVLRRRPDVSRWPRRARSSGTRGRAGP